MVRYRRNFLPGGTFFFTLTLRDRRSSLLVEHIDALRESFRVARERHPFIIDAIVIMPEHLHMVMTLPPDDTKYDTRLRFVKSRFTRALVQRGVALARNARGEYNLWQRRFWEHTIRDDTDLQHHVDYIHFNPVKHGHTTRAVEWPHSSIHRYIRMGWLNANWATQDNSAGIEFGDVADHDK